MGESGRSLLKKEEPVSQEANRPSESRTCGEKSASGTGRAVQGKSSRPVTSKLVRYVLEISKPAPFPASPNRQQLFTAVLDRFTAAQSTLESHLSKLTHLAVLATIDLISRFDSCVLVSVSSQAQYFDGGRFGLLGIAAL